MQARCQVDLTGARRLLQRLLVWIKTLVRRHAHPLEQTLHQLDIGAGQLPVPPPLHSGRLLDQAYAQNRMLTEPGTLRGIERRAQWHTRALGPGGGNSQHQQQDEGTKKGIHTRRIR